MWKICGNVENVWKTVFVCLGLFGGCFGGVVPLWRYGILVFWGCVSVIIQRKVYFTLCKMCGCRSLFTVCKVKPLYTKKSGAGGDRIGQPPPCARKDTRTNVRKMSLKKLCIFKLKKENVCSGGYFTLIYRFFVEVWAESATSIPILKNIKYHPNTTQILLKHYLNTT